MATFDINNFQDWPVTTRYLLVGLLCAIVFYFGYILDISSLKAQIVNDQAKENDLKQQLEMVIDKQEQVRNETAQLQKREKTLTEWQKKLVNYADLPELLNDILKMGATNQLHFALFNPGQEVKEDIYMKVPIKVIVVGNYHQLANFISQVANMPWIVVIGDMTISKENANDVLGAKLAAEANAENLLTAELNIQIYYLVSSEKLKKLSLKALSLKRCHASMLKACIQS